MPDNDPLVPEMRASLDRMTADMSGESKEQLVEDYAFAVKSGKADSKKDNTEKQAIDAYKKNL